MEGVVDEGLNVESSSFFNKRGYRINYKIWKPIKGEIKNSAMVVHGLGEHIERYSEFAKFISNFGFLTFGLDFYGFGRSEGKRGHVFSIEDYISDMKTLYNIVIDSFQLPGKRLVLGHSMGGLLSLAYLERYPEDFSMAIISAPALNPARRVSGILILVAKLLRLFSPSLTMSHGLRPDEITSDRKEQEMLKRDDYVHDRISLNLFFDFFKLAREVQKNKDKINKSINMLMLHGEMDNIALKEDSIEFFNSLDVQKKKIVVMPDMKHEVLTDIKKEKTYRVIEDWLRASL